MAESCSTCRFFKGYEESEPTGECHRRAPSVSPDALAPGRIWPLVGRLNWCGEHEPLVAGVTQVVIHNVGPTDLVFSTEPDHGEAQG